MTTIHIKETSLDNKSVLVSVTGVLRDESILPLKNVCERYWQAERKLLLDIGGLTYITREGREYLQQIRKRVTLLKVPEFLKFG